MLTFPPRKDMSPPPWTLPSGILRLIRLLLFTPAPLPPEAPPKRPGEDDDDFIDKGTKTCGGIKSCCCLFAGFSAVSTQSETALTPEDELLPNVETDTRPRKSPGPIMPLFPESLSCTKLPCAAQSPLFPLANFSQAPCPHMHLFPPP